MAAVCGRSTQALDVRMGHFGHSGFDTDDAMDWLAEFDSSLDSSKISKAFRAYERYVAGDSEGETLTHEQIERVITGALKFWRDYPPNDWRESGMSLEAWLQSEEKRLRERYYSGAYLDDDYGPVETALAAAELVAAAAGVPSATMPCEAATLAKQAARMNRRTIDRAAKVVELILSNEKYRRMRAKFLGAFPTFSGGDDAMAGVKDLHERLRHCSAGKSNAYV